MRVKLHRSRVVSSINPSRGAHCAHTSNALRFVTSSSNVVCDSLADLIDLLDQVSGLDMLLDDVELTQAKHGASQVYVSRSVLLGREETVDLHALSEDNVVGRSAVLPEAGACGATAGCLLIDDESSLRLASNARQLTHEVVAGDIAALIVRGLNHDGCDWARLLSLLSDGGTDALEDLSLLSGALRILDRRPSELE